MGDAIRQKFTGYERDSEDWLGLRAGPLLLIIAREIHVAGPADGQRQGNRSTELESLCLCGQQSIGLLRSFRNEQRPSRHVLFHPGYG